MLQQESKKAGLKSVGKFFLDLHAALLFGEVAAVDQFIEDATDGLPEGAHHVGELLLSHFLFDDTVGILVFDQNAGKAPINVQKGQLLDLMGAFLSFSNRALITF